MRNLRPALAALVALALVVTTTLAVGRPPTTQTPVTPTTEENEQDEQSEQAGETEPTESTEAAPSDKLLDRIVENLKDAGITTTTGDLKDLAEKYGVGGAVRILLFDEAATDKTLDQIKDMRDGGMGWGQIRRELDIAGNSGIGRIMSGGHGGGHGPK